MKSDHEGEWKCKFIDKDTMRVWITQWENIKLIEKPFFSKTVLNGAILIPIIITSFFLICLGFAHYMKIRQKSFEKHLQLIEKGKTIWVKRFALELKTNPYLMVRYSRIIYIIVQYLFFCLFSFFSSYFFFFTKLLVLLFNNFFLIFFLRTKKKKKS